MDLLAPLWKWLRASPSAKVVVCTALAAVYYALLLSEPRFGNPLISRPDGGINLTFNSMLEHMLRGEFDVDPAIIGVEGFTHDGHTYAYWGIVPAFLRMPLLMFDGGLALSVTGLSCLLAIAFAVFMKLQTLRKVCEAFPQNRPVQFAGMILAATLLLSGAQIAFLRANVYTEVCLWAACFGSIIVYGAVTGLISWKFTTGLLTMMAIAAGLGLNTRVSAGIGFYCAMGLLLLALWLGRGDHGEREDVLPLRARMLARLAAPRLFVPAAVLLAFAFVTGFVNYERWGNPLTFLDLRYYELIDEFPERLVRAQQSGLFNPERIPFGLIYYFFPIWAFFRADGRLFLEEHQLRILDVTELPPSSFLVTDLLLLLLLGYGLVRLAFSHANTGLDRARAISVGTGLMMACLLMLTAISMNYRYRLDFYPFLEYGAFLGLFTMGRAAEGSTTIRVLSLAMVATALISMAGSHVSLLLLKVSPYGPGIPYLHDRVYQPLFDRLWH